MIFIIILLIAIIIVLCFKLWDKVVIDNTQITEYNNTINELRIYSQNLKNTIAQQQSDIGLNTEKIKALQQEYTQRNINLDQYFQQLSDTKNKQLELEYERRKKDKQTALEVISQNYSRIIDETSKKTHQVEQDYKEYVKEICDKITQQHEKFNAILEPLKLYEKQQQDKLFYTVQIPEQYRTDIQYLLVNIVPQLRHPDIINKLIWTEYVRPYLDSTYKRVGIENNPGIYKITNINDNKSYIGKSTDIKKRISQHFKSAVGIKSIADQAVHHAMLEQGLWNWSIEPIIYCQKQKLNELEKFYIDFFKTQEYGYNRKQGG